MQSTARAAPEPGVTIDDNLKRKRHNSKKYSHVGTSQKIVLPTETNPVCIQIQSLKHEDLVSSAQVFAEKLSTSSNQFLLEARAVLLRNEVDVIHEHASLEHTHKRTIADETQRASSIS